MTDTWAAYTKTFNLLSPKMGEFMIRIAAAFQANAWKSTDSDDYGWTAEFSHNETKYYAELNLIDASGNGDAEPGEQGNIHLSVTRDGGQIVIAWAPHNYSDECWVSYSDINELFSRLPDNEQASQIIDAILADSVEAAAESKKPVLN